MNVAGDSHANYYQVYRYLTRKYGSRTAILYGVIVGIYESDTDTSKGVHISDSLAKTIGLGKPATYKNAIDNLLKEKLITYVGQEIRKKRRNVKPTKKRPDGGYINVYYQDILDTPNTNTALVLAVLKSHPGKDNEIDRIDIQTEAGLARANMTNAALQSLAEKYDYYGDGNPFSIIEYEKLTKTSRNDCRIKYRIHPDFRAGVTNRTTPAETKTVQRVAKWETTPEDNREFFNTLSEAMEKEAGVTPDTSAVTPRRGQVPETAVDRMLGEYARFADMGMLPVIGNETQARQALRTCMQETGIGINPRGVVPMLLYASHRDTCPEAQEAPHGVPGLFRPEVMKRAWNGEPSPLTEGSGSAEADHDSIAYY